MSGEKKTFGKKKTFGENFWRKENFWPSVLRILERSFRLTASSSSGSLIYMEKTEVWLLKGDQNTSGLYQLLSHRLPLPSGVS